MADEKSISIQDFGASFKGFMDQMASQTPTEAPRFLEVLSRHFETDPKHLPILGESFAKPEHPNVHLALESYASAQGRSSELLGVVGAHEYMELGLSEMIIPSSSAAMGGSISEGPVKYVNLDVGGGKILPCVQQGLYTIKDRDTGPVAVFVQGPGHQHLRPGVRVEAMASTRDRAERFLAGLRSEIKKKSIYRGKILSLGSDEMRNLDVKFHSMPEVKREQIILPTGLLERIERLTTVFSKHNAKLLAASRHIKRGLLFHGPPGTGKTFTAMYLAGQMSDRTVFLLTGQGLGLIEPTCAMARALQPATVILEDVDLVAGERTRPNKSCGPLLFELLNQMDGLADDADVLFLLTTNRPDILEPALAARPGRIDQAIEIPLPDAECRQRLFDLYSEGLTMQVQDMARFVSRTEGASAALIRELLRRSALYSVEERGEIVVDDGHLDLALHELLVDGGQLTRSLLGFRTSCNPQGTSP